MEILVQSLLQKARKLNASVHIRYSALVTPDIHANDPERVPNALDTTRGPVRMNSYVIIRREYSYLEPLVRSIFADADDVSVLIDRRSEERGDTAAGPAEKEARSTVERRSSTPMLDILINVGS